jgi:hypothetical protein
MPTTDEEKQIFLLAVVNAKEKRSTGYHDAFVHACQHFFPPYDHAVPAQRKAHREHYRRVREEWQTPFSFDRLFPVEKELDADYGFKVACLRHQLRVLWVEQSEADSRQDLILSQVATSIWKIEHRKRLEEWRKYQIEALRWLDDRKRLS